MRLRRNYCSMINYSATKKYGVVYNLLGGVFIVFWSSVSRKTNLGLFKM